MPYTYRLTGSISVQLKDPDDEDTQNVEIDVVQAAELGHESGDIEVDEDGDTTGFKVMKAFRRSFTASVTYEVMNGNVKMHEPVIEDTDEHFRVSLLHHNIEVQVDYRA